MLCTEKHNNSLSKLCKLPVVVDALQAYRCEPSNLRLMDTFGALANEQCTESLTSLSRISEYP